MIELNVDFLSYDRIATEASSFLSKYGYGDAIPVPIEKIIEYDLKADIVPIPGLQDVFDIDGATSSDLSTIYVDEFIYLNRPTRYRFTLAHETGHIFLHEYYFRQFSFDSIDGWKEFQDEVDPDDYSRLEFQGYAFGGLVLVPRHHLKVMFENRLSEILPMIKKARESGVSKESYVGAAVDKMSLILAPEFDVSPNVMVRRIEYDSLQTLIP
jgi:hypothetical protein